MVIAAEFLAHSWSPPLPAMNLSLLMLLTAFTNVAIAFNKGALPRIARCANVCCGCMSHHP